MYLDAAADNKASTALSLFLRSVHLHGLPSRVRRDQGVENVELLTTCLPHVEQEDQALFPERAFTYRASLARRLGVTSESYDLLHTLEEDELLDISDIFLLFGVHYIVLPRIRADLHSFTGGWNNHPLRTEGRLSPEQLWQLGDGDLEEEERIQVPHFRIFI